MNASASTAHTPKASAPTAAPPPAPSTLAGQAGNVPLTRVALTYIEPRFKLYLRFGEPARTLQLDRWRRCAVSRANDCLALRANLPITKDRGTTNDLEQKAARSLAKARRVDAVDERIKLKQPGTWVQSRSQYNRGQRREST